MLLYEKVYIVWLEDSFSHCSVLMAEAYKRGCYEGITVGVSLGCFFLHSFGSACLFVGFMWFNFFWVKIHDTHRGLFVTYPHTITLGYIQPLENSGWVEEWGQHGRKVLALPIKSGNGVRLATLSSHRSLSPFGIEVVHYYRPYCEGIKVQNEEPRKNASVTIARS